MSQFNASNTDRFHLATRIALKCSQEGRLSVSQMDQGRPLEQSSAVGKHHTPTQAAVTVQGHGCVLICAATDWRVSHVSQNLQSFFGVEPSDAIGAPAAEIVGREGLHTLRNLMQHAQLRESSERFFRIHCSEWPRVYDVAIQRSGDTVAIEFERREPETAVDAALLVKRALTQLQKHNALEDYFAAAARQLRAITGADCVELHRDVDGAQVSVLARSKKPGAADFADLTTAPFHQVAARGDGVARHPLRVVCDVMAAPQPMLLGQIDASGLAALQSLDLRSLSSTETSMLQHAGVRSVLGAPLLCDGDVWGSFICVSREPRRMSAETRSACELLADLISLQIQARLGASSREQAMAGAKALDQLAARLKLGKPLRDALPEHADLLCEVMAADGLAIVSMTDVHPLRSAPDRAAVEHVRTRLQAEGRREPLVLNNLAELSGSAGADDGARLLVVPMSPTSTEQLVFARRKTASGPAPRWAEAEVHLAEQLRIILLETVLRREEAGAELRKHNAERQDMMIDELRHRVKNLLGLILGLVRVGGASATSLETFVAALLGRIEALSASYDRDFAQVAAEVSLKSMVQELVAPFCRPEGPQLVIEGPDLDVTAEAAPPMALLLHELATNGFKYGALSTRHGRVFVAWQEHGGELTLTWRERGGPVVDAHPENGFGATLITATAPRQLRGAASLDFLADGAAFTLRAPLSNFKHAGPTARSDEQRRGSLPKRFSALIVEDSAIIALDLEDMLIQRGARDIVVVATVPEALNALAEREFDVAFVDYELHGQTADPVLDRIVDQGRPVVLSTGRDPANHGMSEHSEMIVLRKPYSAEAVAAALEKAFAKRT
ncbi:MAG: HWE histidine kinase domain-containing protein [Pseudomonadota bacterium]